MAPEGRGPQWGTLFRNCGGEGQGQQIGCIATQYLKTVGLVILDLESGKIITNRKFRSKVLTGRHLAINPSTNKVYIDDGGKKLLVLNGDNGKQVSTISITRQVGKENNYESDKAIRRPGIFAIDSDKNLVYLTNYNSGTISVINGATNEVISNIKVNSSPSSLVLNPTTNKLYVGYSDSKEITIIDTLSNSIISTVDINNNNNSYSYTKGLAIDISLNKLYVLTGAFESNLFSVDLSNENSISRIEGLPLIGFISINSNTNKIYARIDKSLIVIDSKSDQEVKSFTEDEVGINSISANPVVINPLSNLIYYLSDDKIVVIDGNNWNLPFKI